MDEPLEAEGEVKRPLALGACTWPFVQRSSAKSIKQPRASISQAHQSAKRINQAMACMQIEGPAAGPRDWLIKARKRGVRASPPAFVS